MQYLTSKVVIIIDASSGIGEDTADKLAQARAKLVLSARCEEKLKASMAEK
ncbi:SDR family NAD(P)-dependent oxidoreductase [Necropsobacter massiliensis]|uniref:SDR family NAD(P)-dependent oxidoreductase n=1 Tax=Necropsobacter massiliensis TaxID=1400001 RepID=UPI000A595B40|nr:SDR family NAD(P)-dependent oxidoreductase [Necropsobacter massiliensis]